MQGVPAGQEGSTERQPDERRQEVNRKGMIISLKQDIERLEEGLLPSTQYDVIIPSWRDELQALRGSAHQTDEGYAEIKLIDDLLRRLAKVETEWKERGRSAATH